MRKLPVADTPRKPEPESGTPRSAREGLRVFLETFGCQMNVADSELIVGILSDAGYQTVETPETADIILLNTCAVRENAEQRVFGRLGELTRFKHARPEVIMGVLGCMAERLREQVPKQARAVDLVAGPDSYRRLPDLLERAASETVLDVKLNRDEHYSGLDPRRAGAVTAWIPITRGCDRFCSFCIVPFTRGREKCLSVPEIMRQVREAAEQGYHEVCLLGQTVNSFVDGDTDFGGLLRLVGAVDGVRRVRFMSPHPAGFTESVVSAIVETAAVCPHIHLPVQSGSDAVLKAMRRDYTVEDYRLLVHDLRRRIPGLALSTDIVAGFCGETEEDHRQTMALMAELRFDFAFMFVYSPREGTFAARALQDDVPDEVKKRRVSEIIALQEGISADIHSRLVGTTTEILFERPAKKDARQSFGRTPGFKGVIVEGVHPENEFRTVRITGATAHTLFGEVVSAGEASDT